MLDYLSGKAKDSPRKEFCYVNDDGEIVAARYDDWKVVFLENRGQAFGVWREPFVELRVPLLFNLRRDPFEKSQHNSNTYNDWFLDRAFVLVPIQAMAAQFLMTMKDYPPSQTPRRLQSDQDRGANSKRPPACAENVANWPSARRAVAICCRGSLLQASRA